MFENFIRRDGDRLLDGSSEYRFVSFNIPNLHYVEDDLRFDQPMPFRLPDDFEMNDALSTIEQSGGQVARIYALSVAKPDDPPNIPRYILGPGKFNEEAFVALDKAIAAAGRHHIRLIIPFIDQHSWWGGTAELAGFRNRGPSEFWTNPQVIDDYKAIVTFVVNRVNTITGVPYRDDKSIMAWETGNELKAPDSWTKMAAAHIKSLDANHIVIDGAANATISKASLDDPNVDFVQTHHYEKDPRDMLYNVARNCRLARGKKPYHLGEFGFLGTESLQAVIDMVIREKMTGALIWSLRYRTRDGGFYWHHEPYGGDLFKSYHWPGFEISEPFDERRMVHVMREKAYEIRGLTPPPLPAPAAPHLLTVSPGGLLNWQGSVGAETYDVERADSLLGPWRLVGTGISEAQVQFQPPFVDESVVPGHAYAYRVIARNHTGASSPSNAVGPVHMAAHTLVDNLWNDSRIFLTQGTIRFRQNEARKVKEDCHRVTGDNGSEITYYTKGDISAVKIFAFSKSDQPELRFHVSKDCRDFKPAQADVKRTSTYGEEAYGFLKADVYTVTTVPAGCRYFKIEFHGGAQVGRIEIMHE